MDWINDLLGIVYIYTMAQDPMQYSRQIFVIIWRRDCNKKEQISIVCSTLVVYM